MRSFESHYHAAELRELRKANANDEAFVGGIKDELQAMLSSIVGPTSRSVVARINAVGHRLTPNDAREHPTELCVGYACATPGPGQMRELLFELWVSVVTVDEDAVRDSALRIHVGLSAIVRAIAPTESALDC